MEIGEGGGRGVFGERKCVRGWQAWDWCKSFIIGVRRIGVRGWQAWDWQEAGRGRRREGDRVYSLAVAC